MKKSLIVLFLILVSFIRSCMISTDNLLLYDLKNSSININLAGEKKLCTIYNVDLKDTKKVFWILQAVSEKKINKSNIPPNDDKQYYKNIANLEQDKYSFPIIDVFEKTYMLKIITDKNSKALILEGIPFIFVKYQDHDNSGSIYVANEDSSQLKLTYYENASLHFDELIVSNLSKQNSNQIRDIKFLCKEDVNNDYKENANNRKLISEILNSTFHN